MLAIRTSVHLEHNHGSRSSDDVVK